MPIVWLKVTQPFSAGLGIGPRPKSMRPAFLNTAGLPRQMGPGPAFLAVCLPGVPLGLWCPTLRPVPPLRAAVPMGTEGGVLL